MRNLMPIIAMALLSIVSIVQAQARDLPPCSDVELLGIHRIMPGVEALFDLAAEVRVMDDVIAYGQAHITWREQLWASTPPCAEAFEAALLSNQLTADFVASLLVNARKEASDVNPYTDWQFEGAERFDRLWKALPPPDQANENAKVAREARTLRACTDAERRDLLDTLLPAYDYLTDAANAVETFDDSRRFYRALLRWREESLTRYPPCAESIEIAWLASQTASDIAMLFAFHFVGAPVDAIPYSEPERQGTKRLGELDKILRNSPASETDAGALPDEMKQAIEREFGSPSGGNWRRCSASELQTALDIMPEYEALVATAASIVTMDDLLAYSSEMIDWRENLVFKLAHCGEVLEVAWIMSENLGDLAAMHAYSFVGIPHAENPVFQQVMSNMGGIAKWSETLASAAPQREEEPEAVLGSGALPDCRASELDGVNKFIADHYALHEATGIIDTLEESLAYSTAQIEWREANWARLPFCGDSFEYLLRLTWINSDINIAVILHFFADVNYDDNPFWPQLSLGKERADALLERLRSSNASLRDSITNASQ